MKLLALIAPLLLGACALFRSESGDIDLRKVADQVELVRKDVADLSYLATPELQAKLVKLDHAVLRVEDALRFAGAGGPIGDVRTAAGEALALADALLTDLDVTGQPQPSNLRLYLALARIALRHLNLGDTEAAAEDLAVPSTP